MNDTTIFHKSRNRYLAHGGIEFGRFTIGCVVAAIAVTVVACLMALTDYLGVRMIVVVPLAAGFACGGIAMWAIKFGHCRNLLAGTVLGAALSLFAFVGSEHAFMIARVGVHHAHRVDVLPRFVFARWQTDQIRDVRHEPIDVQPNEFDFWFNVGIWCIEGMLAMIAAAALARTQAGRPYCETHRHWLATSVGVPEPSGNSFDAGRTVQDWLIHKDSPSFQLHHCESPDVAVDPCDVYISAFKPDVTGRNPRGEQLLDKVKLEAPEIAEFAATLPSARLKSIARSETGEWKKVADDIQELGVFAKARAQGNTSVVEPIEPGNCGRLNSSWHLLIRNATVYAPAIFVLLIGGSFISLPLVLPGKMFSNFAPFIGIALLGGGARFHSTVATWPYTRMRSSRANVRAATSLEGHGE